MPDHDSVPILRNDIKHLESSIDRIEREHGKRFESIDEWHRSHDVSDDERFETVNKILSKIERSIALSNGQYVAWGAVAFAVLQIVTIVVSIVALYKK